MAAVLTVAAVAHASCPLCGVRILSVARTGHVRIGDVHPVSLGRRVRAGGEGYMLCDDCGVLAELPADITLN